MRLGRPRFRNPTLGDLVRKKFNSRKAKWKVEFKAQKSKLLFSTDSEKQKVLLLVSPDIYFES